jgi:hypothetical protein
MSELTLLDTALDDDELVNVEIFHKNEEAALLRGVILNMLSHLIGSMNVFCSDAVRKTLTVEQEVRAMYMGARVHVATADSAATKASRGARRPNKVLLKLLRTYNGMLLSDDIGADDQELAEARMVRFVSTTQSFIKDAYQEMTRGYDELEQYAKAEEDKRQKDGAPQAA